MKNLKKYLMSTVLLNLLMIGISAGSAYSADVIAPSKDNVYTLTLTNIGTENIAGVNVSASVLQNPGGLVVIRDVSPQNATIAAGGSQAFQVKFDAECGNLSGTETGKFKFTITKSTPGPLYVKNCGIDPTTCSELEGEFTLETEKNKPIITISGASNGATYYLPVSLTITYSVTDDKDPNPTVTANYPSGTVFDSEGSYSVVVTAKDCAGNQDTKSLSFRIARRPRPDDTYSISDGKPTSITSDPFAKVAVLNRGMIGSLASILSGLKETYAVINLPLDSTELQKYPLLIIPSDGLNGLDNSPSFKEALQTYAQNGGVILSFTQERGYMLDTLPGDWQGVGYLEENGCQTYAGGIENQHVFFSGQDSVYIDANVDGYFTSWPTGGKVLVRRTKNAMPCLISYPVGQGIVLASTLYSDYGYISGQINVDEKRLIRDIISWSKDIVSSINSYPTGTLVKETVQIQNSSNVEANSVTYTFYDPDKKLVFTLDETIPSPLAPGQYAEGKLEYQLPASGCPIGIYWIKYQLKDAAGNTIQPEQPVSRFAVQYNIGTVNISKDINVLVKTTQPFYPVGSTGTFEISVTNSKTTDVPVRLRYGTSFHDPLYSAASKTVTEDVIPANGSKTYTVDVANLSRGDYLSAGLFDQSERTLAFGQEKFYVFYPYVRSTVSIDKAKYLPEESGTISYNLSYDFLRFINKTEYVVTANVRILDQTGAKITENMKTLLLTGNTYSDSLSFTSPLKGGRYIAQVEILSFGKQVGLASSYFEVITGNFVTIAAHYPATWLIGADNALSFDVKNVSLSTLPSGAVKATLFDPDNTAVWSEEKQFLNLPAGSTTTVAFTVPLANGKFGNYRVKYELSYMENLYKYFADFSNQVVFDLRFDKLSYKMRENMLLNLDVINNGVFEGDVSVTVEIPTFGYTDTRSVRVSRTAAVSYTVPVPATILSGTHDLNVRLNLVNQLSKTYQFGVPPSRLTLSIDKNSYTVGDTGTITVTNIGGVDTNYSINIKLLDVNGNLVNETTETATVQASSSRGTGFSIPGSAMTGNYLVQTECKNLLKGDEITSLSELINVSGVTGTVDVRTDKKTYLSSDIKNILSTLVNTSGKDINNATLRLRIYAQTDCKQPAQPAGAGGVAAGGEGDGPYIYPMVPDQFVCTDSNTYSFNLHPYEHSRGGQQITPKVLLIEDADSWNTGYQNEVVLNSLTIPYTRITSGQLAQTDLYQYTHIIIPSDQPQSMYNNLDANMSRVTGWIQAGGSFQFNACDVGWANGHWTYGPDQLRHVYPVYVQQNYIRTPDHPVLQGMTDSNFYNWNYVSHGYFTNVPANAQILLSANSDGSRPTLIDYTLGSGHIVASQNTLEWTNAGRNCPNCNRDILDNIVKYMFQIGFDNLKWSASDIDPGLMSISIDPAMDIMRITPVPGTYGADQVLLTLTDQAGLTATQWINVAVSPTMPDGNLIWEKEIPVNALSTLDLTTEFDISQYKLTGKFYVEGTLISDIKQDIAKDIDSFYIIDSQLGLQVETDKRVYKPGETVTITASVTNNAAVGETGLTLTLAKDGTNFYTPVFNLASGETKTFTTTLTASASFLLGGKVKDVRIVDHVTVESPQVVLTVAGPDVAGFESFDLSVKLENTGKTDAAVNLNFAGETHQVTIPANQSVSFERSLNITNTTTFYITLSGDFYQSVTKTVSFGALASIALSPKTVYPEGAVDVPYTITNTGSTDLAFSVDFTLGDAATGQSLATVTVPVNLLVSGRVSDVLVFNNMTAGSYRLSYASPLGSGSASFAVSRFNLVLVENVTVGTSLTADGKLPVSAVVKNAGANSFAGELLFDTGFYQEMRSLQLAIGQSLTVTINVPLTVGPGNYEALFAALYNYVSISEVRSPFTLMSRFALTSLPTDPVFTPGEFGNITLTVQNQGLVGGMVSVSIKSGDLIDIAQADRLSAGGQKSFSFNFPIAEDIVANWYNAVITVTNLDTGTANDTPLRYYVQGYDIGVSVKTDKPCYVEGDTARVTLKVNNNAERGVELEALASFNDFYERQPFSLGGKPVLDQIDTTTNTGDLLLNKVATFAETDMGVYDSNSITLTGGGTATYSYAWCYDQNGDIWTYGWSNGPLSKFNGKTGAWIKNVNLPYSGHLQIAVDKDGRMYGGYYYGTTIAVFNPETGAAIATHNTPNNGYVGGVFWDGQYLWFGEVLWSGNKYYRVDVSGGGWNIVNTFTSNFTSFGYGIGVVGNRLLIANSTQDSFVYHYDLDFNTNTMSASYNTTPSQSWDYFTAFNYNGKFLQRKGYYSGTIRNYRAYRKAYAPSGTLVSSVQDVGSSEGAALSWDAVTGTGTSVKVETRTGNVLSPDNTWSAWQEQSNSAGITSPVSRFLQYRLTLATTDDTVSPVLHSLTVDLPQQSRQIVHTSQEDFEKMPVSVGYSVPVSFTGQKLFYGVYSKTGWGIYLNSLYLCEASGDLMLYTDKQVYNAGEVVTVHVYPYKTGSTLTVSAIGYETTFTIQDTAPFDIQFTLPAEMATGTYSIRADFLGKTIIYNFDVVGYTVVIQNRALDKSEYYPGDQMRTTATLDSNHDISGVTVIAWISSGGQAYTYYEMTNLTLANGTNTLEFQGIMPSHTWGFADVTIALFKAKDGDPYAVFLAADSIGFDVPDKTAPMSGIVVGDPRFESAGDIFVAGATTFTVTGEDAGTVVSGLDRVEYNLNNIGSWIRYQSPFNLSGSSDGNILINYRAVDKAGNSGSNTLKIILDGTPPETSGSVGAPQYTAGGNLYISGGTLITLSAADAGSGVQKTEYAVDSGAFTGYAGPLNLAAYQDGAHSITYRSADNLGITETSKNLAVVLDKTAPTTTIAATDPVAAGAVNIISPGTVFSLSATDSVSGVKATLYSIDNGEWRTFTEGFTLSALNTGRHVISYKSTDNVLNEETAQSIAIQLIVLNLTKKVDSSLNVLVGAWKHYPESCAEDAVLNGNLDRLEAMLAAAGVSYYLPGSKEDFKVALRSGRYNTYLIFDIEEEYLGNELKESVYSGDGLLFLKIRPDDHPQFGDVFGAAFFGASTNSDLAVQLTDSPISSAGSMQTGGKVVTATITGNAAQSFAYVSDERNTSPSIIFNQYGRGRAMVYLFDLVGSPDQAQAEGLLINSLNYVWPAEDTVRSLDSAPVKITVNNSPEPVDVKLIETLPDGTTVDSIVPQAEQKDNTITWLKSLGPDEKAGFGYYLNLPDSAGTYKTSTELRYYNGSEYRVYGVYDLPLIVRDSSGSLLRNITAELSGITADNRADSAAIAKAIQDLQSLYNDCAMRSCAAQNIHRIINAADELRKVSIDVSSIRLQVDELLKIWEKKWFLLYVPGEAGED